MHRGGMGDDVTGDILYLGFGLWLVFLRGCNCFFFLSIAISLAVF